MVQEEVCDIGEFGVRITNAAGAFDWKATQAGRLDVDVYQNDERELGLSLGDGGETIILEGNTLGSLRRTAKPVERAVGAFLEEWLGEHAPGFTWHARSTASFNKPVMHAFSSSTDTSAENCSQRHVRCRGRVQVEAACDDRHAQASHGPQRGLRLLHRASVLRVACAAASALGAPCWCLPLT